MSPSVMHLVSICDRRAASSRCERGVDLCAHPVIRLLSCSAGQELIEDLIRCSVGFSEARSTSDTKALIWLRRMSTPVFCPGDIALVWIF
jgi:hypothetical protein